MSIATFERALLMGARRALNDPRLRMKDIREWSTGDCEEVPGEIRLWVPDPGVNVAVMADHDRRPQGKP